MAIGNTNSVIGNENNESYKGLSAAQETILVNTGTYNGRAVANGTVFTTEDGKFKEFVLSEQATAKTNYPQNGNAYVSGGSFFKGVWVLTTGNYTYYSEDNGTTWSQTSPNFGGEFFADDGQTLFMAQYGGTGLYKSTDGKTWDTSTLSKPESKYIKSFTYCNGTFYILHTSNSSATNPCYYSTDNCSTWTVLSAPNGVSSFTIATAGNKLILIPANSSTWYYTTDNGTNWTSFTPTGITNASAGIDYFYIYSLPNGSAYIGIGSSTNSPFYFTTDGLNYSVISGGSAFTAYPRFGYVAGKYIQVPSPYYYNSYINTSSDGITFAQGVSCEVASALSVFGSTSMMLASGRVNAGRAVGLISFMALNALSYNKTEVDGLISAVDQTFDGTSANAQSGVAIEGAGFLKNLANYKGDSLCLGTGSTARYQASVVLGADATTSNNNTVAIGYRATAYGVSIGNYAKSLNSAIAIGPGGSSSSCAFAVNHSIALGYTANAGGYSTSGSGIASYCIAIGDLAKAVANYAIQLGSGTNSTANTFSVGLSDSNNYQLLNSSGNIPEERLGNTLLTGTTAPATITVGTLGQLYKDTVTGIIYRCAAINNTDPQNPVYTWNALLENLATGSSSISIGNKAASALAAVNVGYAAQAIGYGVSIGYNAKGSSNGVAIGNSAAGGYGAGIKCTAVGANANCGGANTGAFSYATALGAQAGAHAQNAIQIGYGNNTNASTLSIGFYDASNPTNWQLLDGTTGTIPEARLTKIIISGENDPTIATVGTIGLLYKNTTSGAIFKCTAIDNTDPNNIEYTWEELGAGSSSGSGAETYTNPALTSDGTYCTWTVNHTLGTKNFVSSVYNTSTGKEVMFEGTRTSDTVYTIKLTSDSDISSGDYTVVMVKSGGSSGGSGLTSTSVTIATSDWSSNSYTATVQGMTASKTVVISPAPNSTVDYTNAGILCTAQGTDELTFECDTVPSNSVTINIVYS